MKTTEIYLYGARDTSTGKLVSNLTNPKKKFWQRKHACKEAIDDAMYGRYKKYNSLELVTFKLVEVEDETTLNQPCTNLKPTQEQGHRKQSEGEWIKKGLSAIVCSACEYIAWDYHNTPYCPHCGARMKGGD